MLLLSLLDQKYQNRIPKSKVERNPPKRRIELFSKNVIEIPGINSIIEEGLERLELTVHPKSDDSRKFLEEILNQHYLFATMHSDDMQKIIDYMKCVSVETDQVIVEHHEFGNSLFCVDEGSLDEIVEDNHVASYSQGGCFGELGMMYNSMRSAFVIANSPSRLWSLDMRYPSMFLIFAHTLTSLLAITNASLGYIGMFRQRQSQRPERRNANFSERIALISTR